MASSLPPYALTTATDADIPAIMDIIEDAFIDDPLTPYLKGDTDPVEFQRRRANMHTTELVHSHLTGGRYVLARENSTGEANGVAVWEFPLRLTDAEKAEKEAIYASMMNQPPLPGANRSLRREFIGTQEVMKEKYCDPERDIYLSLLGVKRSHTRRGIGSLLLADGTAHADRMGANIFVMASAEGMHVYLRQGWEPLEDEWVLDMAKHGVLEGGKILHKCLLRKPNSRTTAGEEKQEMN